MLNPSCTVTYHVSDPALKKRIRADLANWHACIPDWVRDLHVTHTPVDEERPITAAQVEVNYAYWKLSLTVHDRYFLKSDKERRAYFIHEMLHAHIAPLTEHYGVVENEHGMDPALVTLAVNVEERSVESITYMIRDLLGR